MQGRCVLRLVPALAVFTPALAFAQGYVDSGSANALTQLSGQNAAQSGMAFSIDRVCPTLANNSQLITNNDRSDLLTQCSKMVTTATRANGGGVPAGQGNFDLGLDSGGLNNALQSINGEEAQVPSLQGAQARSNVAPVIAARLAALRNRGVLAERPHDLGSSPLQLNQFAATDATAGLATEQPWGIFVNGNFLFGNQDASSQVSGFDTISGGGTVGVDYRVDNNLILGGAFTYTRTENDFDVDANTPSGQFLDSNRYEFSVFGTYFVDDHWYINGIAAGALSTFDARRHIVIPSSGAAAAVDRFADGDFDGWSALVSLSGGYEIRLGSWAVTPAIRLEYQRNHTDGFSETGASGLNLDYGSVNDTSFVTGIGATAVYNISTELGILSPSARLEWVHQFLDGTTAIPVQYSNDPTGLSRFNVAVERNDSDYALAGVGVSLDVGGLGAFFANYGTVLGLRDVEAHAFQVGARFNF